MVAGYSGTPLAKKLGLKEDFAIMVVNAPKHYFDLFPDFPESIKIKARATAESIDFIHLFCTSMEELETQSQLLRPLLKKTGILWVSWPKGSSKIPTNLKRDPIRGLLLRTGLVDVKVCAIDENWSGLKFVYRLTDR